MTPLLTIDLDALGQNYTTLVALAQGAEVAGVVKANAYGLGIRPVVERLVREGCKTLFVAHASEALAIRTFDQETQLFVLNGFTNAAELAALRNNNITPVINSAAALACFDGGTGALHIDTGMSRLGLDAAETMAFLADPTPIEDMILMTHLASSDDGDLSQNAAQVSAFAALVDKIKPARVSLNNSAGTLIGDNPRGDLLRPGIALYGAPPRETTADLKQVIRLTAPIVQLRDIAAGTPVGYGASWIAARPSRIATLPVGYADGFLRSQSGKDCDVAWHGQRLPIVGRVSMDLITVDVTDAALTLQLGDHLEVIGTTIPLTEVAARAGTIPYEVLTSLGTRYERRYV